MSKNLKVSKVFIIISILLIISALFLYRIHVRRLYSEPESTTKEFMHAVASANLANMQKASSPAYYARFVQHFGKRKFERVQYIYQLLYREGLPIWRGYRQKAELLASQEYNLLRQRVIELGRKKFSQLDLDKRMQLIEDRAKFYAFLFEAGVQELPPDQRKRIVNIDEFRDQRDRDQFIERELWNVLPREDQKILGSPAALAKNDTPEKLAFIDRVALRYLPEREQKEIAGISRSELNNPSEFMLKYGEPLAKAFLETLGVQWSLPSKPCSFPAEDSEGSLLRGSEAICSVNIFSKKDREQWIGIRTFKLTLRKEGFRWIVVELQPNLFEVY